ncbi:pyroglutamyl-peptidase I [Streptomyces kaniharaensis]|uniref:Pyrrolidone-carboxylate peptidase n=1 Tax=Streptomyces kaniharaensis TaxID=212423 RepID=A0A6N7L3I3_9ACTN|nr:pyroglutamyl-peptidase I [Streptomyces kaniharaensis]MQS16714.1 pyroglutamyl-peptidase I [Streptomyces kaniharaensis]
MTRILLTGFEPFDGATRNPSWEAARLVADHPPAGLEVTPARLSCVFGRAADELRAAVRDTDPDVVVCLGQATGRPDVSVERIAVNIDDARIPDNAGRRPVDWPVVPGGPAAYFATLPVKACVAAVRAAGLPSSLSHTAGTFVCNHVFYALMHLIATERPTTRGGFVHLPALPEQVLDRAEPALPAATAARALRALLTASTRPTDLHTPEGTTH